MEKANDELFQLAISLGGTLTGEHGIGLVKAAYMHLEHDPVAMAMMRAVKQAFDPLNILNPGKMALDESGPGLKPWNPGIVKTPRDNFHFIRADNRQRGAANGSVKV